VSLRGPASSQGQPAASGTPRFSVGRTDLGEPGVEHPQRLGNITSGSRTHPPSWACALRAAPTVARAWACAQIAAAADPMFQAHPKRPSHPPGTHVLQGRSLPTRPLGLRHPAAPGHPTASAGLSISQTAPRRRTGPRLKSHRSGCAANRADMDVAGSCLQRGLRSDDREGTCRARCDTRRFGTGRCALGT